MPDVTSTLLAMYQQVIGGSTAREQSSVEAECARRVILSGMTISGAGSVNFPVAMTISTLQVGAVTAGSLIVSGNSIFSGAVQVVGLLTAQGGLAVTGAASVTGLVTASAGLAVTGNTTIAGRLDITVGPVCTFTAAVTGNQIVQIQNTAVGTANAALLNLGNDTAGNILTLQVLSSAFTSSALNLAGGATLAVNGTAGVSIATTGAAPVRLYTNGLERMRVDSGGQVCIGQTAIAPGNAPLNITFNSAGQPGMGVLNSSSSNSGFFLDCFNSAAAFAGGIQHTGATTVAYVTSSDARLKIDHGVATDLTALRALRVHEFTWAADGIRDRGVFAQETYDLYPRAVCPGTDARTASGDLARPWMTDYSKFVPDLIVGWHAHEDAVQDLQAAVRALQTRLRGAA